MTSNVPASFKKRLLSKWKYSYLAVYLLPLLIVLSLGLNSLITMNRVVTRMNTLAVRFMYHEFDSVFSQVNSISQDLLLGPGMQRLSRSTEVEELDPLYLYETSMSLFRMLGKGSALTDLMIFSPTMDFYISTSRWGTLENLPLLDDFNLRWDQARYAEIFGKKPTTLRIENASCDFAGGNKAERILIVRPLSFAQSGWQHEFAVAILVDVTPGLSESLSSLQDFLIINRVSNTVLYNFGNTCQSGSDAGVLGEIPAGESRRIGDKIASVAASEVTNAQYVVLMGRSSYFRTLMIFFLIALGYFLLALLGGWAIMRWRINRDWSLYEQAIIDSGTILNDEQADGGIYYPFVSSVSRLKVEKEGMSQIIHTQTRSLRSHLIARLMAGSIGTVSVEALKASGVDLYSNLFVVTIFSSTALSLEGEREANLIKWFEEAGYAVLPSSSPNGTALILNTELKKSTTQSLAHHITLLVRDEHWADLRIASSDMVEGLENLGRAYLDAVNVLEYQRGIGSAEFMTASDMFEMSSQTNYLYSSEQELHVGQMIQAGEEAEAIALIRRIIESNRADGVSPHRLRYLLFAIAGTVVKTANQLEGRYPGLIPSLSLPPILQADDFELSLQTVEALVTALCAAIREIERQFACDGGVQYDLYRQALALVHLTFKDSSVNVSSIADQLGVSTTLLSRVFKKYHVQNISDYLSFVRVETAKGLLAEGKIIADIVDECGFGSLRTFMRVFKSYEQITPGQYRALTEQEE